ncbi:hypothetical protein ELY10_01300 [Legionella septentrionalis]|nr:hypothetical protein ELY10_01300 [Legionella septentrionalis]
MSTPEVEVKEAMSSEKLHNKNCHAYLLKIKEAIPSQAVQNLPENVTSLFAELAKIEPAYHPETAYADLYSRFFRVVEDEFLPWIKDSDNIEIEREWDNFFFAIYHNDNNILPNTYEAIREIPANHRPVANAIEHKVSQSLLDSKSQRINKEAQTPAEAGSAYGRFTAMISANFKPQHTTSIATVRTYQYNDGAINPENKKGVTEYRFGTQAQRHHGEVRVSPLFEHWLQVQERQASEKSITHIYFNNLGKDRPKKLDFEGHKEKALTTALHDLETDHENIAVITLPADKGLMGKSDFKKTNDHHSYQKVREEFLHIALEDGKAQEKIKDFHISPKVREILFCDSRGKYSKELEEEKLNDLLNNSFIKMGIDPTKNQDLSSAQRQAVWFHFTKYELPNFIIETINPVSINFSCKDAIDRGGVSSAYYNLMKSIESGQPLSRKEFECALHAAPAMVKARGMNHHSKLIWNTVDAYINQNYEQIRDDPKKAWLIEWRDLNCPHSRVEALLNLRTAQVLQELRQREASLQNSNLIPAKENQLELKSIAQGIKILENIEQQHIAGVSGKRLLLEAVTRTAELLLPSVIHVQDARINIQQEKNLASYLTLAKDLTVKYPALQTLGGFMKALVGTILLLPTFGLTKGWVEKGWATCKAGFAGREKGLLHDEGSRSTQVHEMQALVEEQKKYKEQMNAVKEQDHAKENEDIKPVDGITLV